jgi:N-formylglutamate deformylase
MRGRFRRRALFLGPALGATLVTARFPRSYIDPNRSILDLDTSLLDGAWPGPGDPQPQDRARHRLIWRILDSGETIYGASFPWTR